MYDENNVFAKIISKSLPAEIIYEDDKVISFNDINPAAPIHIIVIPKKKYIDYSDFINTASGEEIKDYFIKLSYIAEIGGVKDGSYRLITNKGSKAGQTIFHFHFHIISGKSFTSLIGS